MIGVYAAATQPIHRRAFLADLGRGAFAVAIVSVAGCAPAAIASLTPPPGGGPSNLPSPSGTGGQPGSSIPPGGSPPPGAGVTWSRVNLGFVSAYVLVRSGEAAIVDTGVAGSAGAIETSLTGLGLGWGAVGHLILTHHHGDHAGSASEVLGRAPSAVAYAGAADIGSISVPRPLTAIGDGEDVFGLRVVTTPGHTPGSISVLDPVAGVVVAGDALRTANGKPALPGEQFTVDMAEAKRSIVKLGAMTFETLLVGHGDPIEAGASTLVAELGAAG